MKVLWLAPYPLGTINTDIWTGNAPVGTGNWLVNLAALLCENQEIDLHIVTFSPRLKDDITLSDGGIKFHLIRHSIPFFNKGFPDFFRADAMLQYYGLVKKMNRKVNEISPDVLHIHGTEGPYGFSGVLLRNQYPVILSIQGILQHIVKQQPKSFYRIQSKWERLFIQRLSHFGCRTHFDKAFVRALNPNSKIHYLPEVIDEVFYFKTWNGQNSNRLLFVGSIVKRKGIEDLIEVMQRIGNTHDLYLDVIGSGDTSYVELLKKKCKDYQLGERVIWHGFKRSPEIAESMSKARVYVLPTYSDNSPNSLCEAMAVGVPSIAYDVGGVASLIQHEKDAMLCTLGDINALSEAILKLTTRSGVEMSINARETALNRNKSEVVRKHTLEVYNDVINEFRNIDR